MRARRNHPDILVATVLVLLLSACTSPGPEADSSDGTWVGTITTEGNVTTVINESGSVWGGTAKLVEEASIGVDVGEDPYMLSNVTSIWATDDDIYVVDAGVPAVRVYDRDGSYRHDIGRRGQGPGEYVRPHRISVGPDGRIFLVDRGGANTVRVYSASGAYVATWSWPGRAMPVRQHLVVTLEGILYLEAIVLDRGMPIQAESRFGMQPVGPEGKAGEFREFPRVEFASPILTYLDGGLLTSVPFMPEPVKIMMPSGAFAYGVGDQYRLMIQSPDGHETSVERASSLVPIHRDERVAHETFTTSQIRSRDPGWSWNGAPIPAHKPAFTDFYAAQDGRLLVERPGPGSRADVPNCTDDPTPNDFIEARRQGRTLSVCWSEAQTWDMFGPDGRYLGDLNIPDLPMLADPFLSGNTILLAIEDEAGTIMVKRYRLVLPGEEQ